MYLVFLNIYKYVFEIHPSATKPQVREAVERYFNVNVASVNTIKIKPEIRRFGGSGRRTKVGALKKAVVTLKPGQTIQIFEGA